MQREKDWPFLALKMDGATSQRMWAISTSQKKQKTDFLVKPQERNAALLTLRDPFPDLQNCEIKIYGVPSHKICGNLLKQQLETNTEANIASFGEAGRLPPAPELMG